MIPKTSMPRKQLHLPRQQKNSAVDGKSDGKGPRSITTKPFNHAGQRSLLIIEWEWGCFIIYWFFWYNMKNIATLSVSSMDWLMVQNWFAAAFLADTMRIFEMSRGIAAHLGNRPPNITSWLPEFQRSLLLAIVHKLTVTNPRQIILCILWLITPNGTSSGWRCMGLASFLRSGVRWRLGTVTCLSGMVNSFIISVQVVISS